MADDTRHAAVVESLKATASELHARPPEEMNQDWADRMAENLAAAGLLAAPAKSEVPGAMPNQPGDQDHCAVCNHMRWRHHDGVCTEYLDCECNGNFAEHPIAVSPAAPARAMHYPALAERTDGTWGVFCTACSKDAGEFTYPCRDGWIAPIPAAVVGAAPADDEATKNAALKLADTIAFQAYRAWAASSNRDAYVDMAIRNAAKSAALAALREGQ